MEVYKRATVHGSRLNGICFDHVALDVLLQHGSRDQLLRSATCACLVMGCTNAHVPSALLSHSAMLSCIWYVLRARFGPASRNRLSERSSSDDWQATTACASLRTITPQQIMHCPLHCSLIIVRVVDRDQHDSLRHGLPRRRSLFNLNGYSVYNNCNERKVGWRLTTGIPIRSLLGGSSSHNES